MTAGPPRAEDRQMTEFPQRQIGHTGLQVTELGLGCATLGGSQIAVARAAAEEIVGVAWAAGVRYVDTAPYYGVGQAERCVGDALRDCPRGEWVLSKGRPAPSRSARPAPGITIYDSRESRVGRPRRCRSGSHISVVTTGATLTMLDGLSVPSRLA
jgi:aryl-alcohol dehydrogenase-like predicted oxidoreductase